MRTLTSQMSSSQIASNLQGNSSNPSFGSGFGAAISMVVKKIGCERTDSNGVRSTEALLAHAPD